LAAVTRLGTLAVVTGSAPEEPVRRSASAEQPASNTAAAADIKNFDLEEDLDASQAERQTMSGMPRTPQQTDTNKMTGLG
jgi:hypothetical protein